MFKKFLKGNLDAADRCGTREQQNDMAGAISEMSREINELSDMMGAGEKQTDWHTTVQKTWLTPYLKA